MRKIRVKRHSSFFIVLHWLMVAETLTLLVSGISLAEGLGMQILSRPVARDIHIAVGSAWIATVILFAYYIFTGEEYKWLGLSRLGYAFDFFMSEVRHFLNGERIESPIRYSLKLGDYVEKVVPTEVLSFWCWMAILAGMGITGVALLLPEHFGLLARFSAFLFPNYGNPFAALRTLHFLLAAFVLLMMVFHAYAAVVFGLLPSMITGYRYEKCED